MFNATEVVMGPAARAMTYKIQKWNVRSVNVHPILVANTRVDWLALEDAEISQNFPILREGILYRTSSHNERFLPGKVPSHSG